MLVCWADLFSADCILAVEQIRNIAIVAGAFGALAIPFVIAWASRRIEERHATADFIRTIMTAPDVVALLERLYQRRQFDESSEIEREKLFDPYSDGKKSQLFDMAIVLNYFEALCHQIENNVVNEEYIFEAAKDTVIGVRTVVLQRYENLSGVAQEQYHPQLVSVGDRWQERVSKDRILLQPKIPDLAGRSSGG